MKRIKFLLALLMVMLGTAVQAQQVVINKSDGSVEVFQPNEVDSVVYKPAPKYYYYAGWECPRNEAELASKGTLIGSSYSGFEYDYTLNENQLHNTVEKATVYVVVPGDIEIWSSDKNDKLSGTSFQKVTEINISNHTVYASVAKFWDVDMIVLMKK